MDKQKAQLTQQMWKDNPNVQKWIKTLQEMVVFGKHMYVCENKFSFDNEFRKAVEGLSFLLIGEEEPFSYTKEGSAWTENPKHMN